MHPSPSPQKRSIPVAEINDGVDHETAGSGVVV